MTSVAEDSVEKFRASTIDMREKLECALRPILDSCCTSDYCDRPVKHGSAICSHSLRASYRRKAHHGRYPTKREVLPDRASFNKPTAGVVCHEHHVRTVYNKLRKANVEHTTSAEC